MTSLSVDTWVTIILVPRASSQLTAPERNDPRGFLTINSRLYGEAPPERGAFFKFAVY